MGDFAEDTAVFGGDGRYKARLSADWEIWGPQGGYIATVALRAAGQHSRFQRPATFYCHYLSVAEFDAVDIEAETLRASKRVESVRVSVRQSDRPIMEAVVWLVDELTGVDHLDATMPKVPDPGGLRSWAEIFPGTEPPFPFWKNVEGRPCDFDEERQGKPGKPQARVWMRFHPKPVFDDPFLEAGRLLTVADVYMYPASVGAHGEPRYVAPSMDLAVTFHQSAEGSEWLLTDAQSPISQHGLVGGRASVWSEDGRLLATAIQQMLQR